MVDWSAPRSYSEPWITSSLLLCWCGLILKVGTGSMLTHSTELDACHIEVSQKPWYFLENITFLSIEIFSLKFYSAAV